VDVPVTVNTTLTTDEGFMSTSTAQPVMGSITNYTATFTISSFGRNESGMYTCVATVSLPSNAYVSDSSTVRHSVVVTTGKIEVNVCVPYLTLSFSGVYLALKGMEITNDSNINIRDIGQSSDNPNGALQCITDNLRCCHRNPRLGEWYQPNGSLVQGTSSTTTFYRTRGDNGEVSLNRPSGVESSTGRFCCEVPDATSKNQTLCVNFGMLHIIVYLHVCQCWIIL
jgi:hypothetical protein